MLKDKLKDRNVILASQSPRRQMLLKGLEIPFEVKVKDYDEEFPDDLKFAEVARYLAVLKASAIAMDLEEKDILITSDTTVCLGDDILNKPESRSEAISMLQQLRNNTHSVVTAVALTSTEKQEVFHDETEVTFGHVTDEEIEHYVDQYQPFDKAGSYGAQDFLGYIAITGMNGSYYNVMGFPLHLVYRKLMEF
ncbi:MAG: septum formation protein Maf [Flavobacteriales bacterium]|nr:septum formation protein Maf [Flavobacteriales bacterium]